MSDCVRLWLTRNMNRILMGILCLSTLVNIRYSLGHTHIRSKRDVPEDESLQLHFEEPQQSQQEHTLSLDKTSVDFTETNSVTQLESSVGANKSAAKEARHRAHLAELLELERRKNATKAEKEALKIKQSLEKEVQQKADKLEKEEKYTRERLDKEEKDARHESILADRAEAARVKELEKQKRTEDKEQARAAERERVAAEKERRLSEVPGHNSIHFLDRPIARRNEPQCSDIMNHGQWTEMNYWGWWRRVQKLGDVRVPGEMEWIDDPSDSRFPWERWPQDLAYPDQTNVKHALLRGYDGVWAPRSSCKLHTFNADQAQSCLLDNMTGEIQIIGDSRGRQLKFLFTNSGGTENNSITHRVHYTAQQTFDDSEASLSLQMACEMKIVIERAKKRDTSYMIFTDHILHPVMQHGRKSHEGVEAPEKEDGAPDDFWVHVKNNVVLTPNDTLWVKEMVVDKFESQWLSELLELLTQKPDLVIIFTASYMPLRFISHGIREHVAAYVTAYNHYMGRLITAQKHPRLVWMGVLYDLGLTRDGHVLSADGTHFDYPLSAASIGNQPRLAANRYYLRLLMNYMCVPSLSVGAGERQVGGEELCC